MHSRFGDEYVEVVTDYLQKATDPTGGKLYHGAAPGRDLRPGRCAELADRFALPDSGCAGTGSARRSDPVAGEGLVGTVQFLNDLCHVQAAAAGEVSRICAELVFGYTPPSGMGRKGTCSHLLFRTANLTNLNKPCPAFRRWPSMLSARTAAIQESRPVRGLRRYQATFSGCRPSLPTCLTGSRLAKDRAADTRKQGDDSRSSGLSRMRPNRNRPATAAEATRQTMDVDIACAGFGPAMGGFLTTLTHSWSEHPADPAFAEQGRAGHAAPGTLLRARRRYCRRGQRRGDACAKASAPAFRRSIQPRFPWPRRSPRSAFSIYWTPSAPAAVRRTLACGRFYASALESWVLRLDHDAFELDWTPAFLHKKAGWCCRIGQFNQWVGSRLMASGLVQIGRERR